MLHRNLLFPIGFLPTADKTDQIDDDDQEKSETEASVNYSDSDSENEQNNRYPLRNRTKKLPIDNNSEQKTEHNYSSDTDLDNPLMESDENLPTANGTVDSIETDVENDQSIGAGETESDQSNQAGDEGVFTQPEEQTQADDNNVSTQSRPDKEDKTNLHPKDEHVISRRSEREHRRMPKTYDDYVMNFGQFCPDFCPNYLFNLFFIFLELVLK